MKKLGRKKPYTARGIRRIACLRCGQPATQQWSVCSLDNHYVGICDLCDVLLNDTVLAFMAVPHRLRRMKRYTNKVARTVLGS